MDCFFFVSSNDLSIDSILSVSQGHDENQKSVKSIATKIRNWLSIFEVHDLVKEILEIKYIFESMKCILKTVSRTKVELVLC